MKNKESNNAVIWTVVGVFVLFLLLGGFGMMGFVNYGMGGMMNWMFGAGFGFMWIFGMMIWILVIIALILFIMWLIKQLQSPRRR